MKASLRMPTALAAVAAVSALTFGAMPTATAASNKTCGKDKSKGLEAVALTKNGRLLCVDVDNPGKARSLGKVDGLTAGTTLIGIDYRAQNGKLYGVGSNGDIYTISAKDADATKVATMSTVPAGAAFGIDFNPTVDRLRVISDTGKNYRVDVTTGATTTDGDLTNPVPPPGMGTETALGVTAAAYTNNDKLAETATATTLFDIDTTKDRVALQSPANAGNLAATGTLGRNVDPDSGFDIYSTTRSGQARTNAAFAALSNGSRSTLYAVDLLDGSLKSLGKFASKRGEIIGLALPLNQK